jgi:hypothetical protein
MLPFIPRDDPRHFACRPRRHTQFAEDAMTKRCTLATFLLLLTTSLFAQQQDTSKIEIPLIDLPYNVQHGLRGPSMQQSLAITSDFYELSHRGIQDLFGERDKLGKSMVGVLDVATILAVPVPLADAWLHEEWHRAVMGNRGINSFNDVYLLDFSSDAINVSHVRDEDLIRLKREHNSDLVRLDEAGIEAELALAQRLEKRHFFDGSRTWHLPLYWLTKISTAGYVSSALARQTELDTIQANIDEGANVKKRDFTGHDFLGWIYDLSRPDEPYQARGIHPSGVGIDRYRKPSDLTPEERRFIHRMGKMQFINFADPNLVGVDDFHANIGGRRIAFNVTGSHELTSFGYAVDANIFLRAGNDKLFVALHQYGNEAKRFPGAEAEIVDRPMRLFGRDVLVTPRLAVWMQPENQRFRDTRGKLGGLGALRIDVPMRNRFGSFMEVEAKTDGWSMGNVHLDRNVDIRFGVTRTIG